VHVHPYQDQAQVPVQHGDDDETDPRLDGPAVELDRHHQEMLGDLPPAVRRRAIARTWLVVRRHQDEHPDHHRREHPVEPHALQSGPHEAAQNRPR